MSQLLYKIIYNEQINLALRTINKKLLSIFPGLFQVPPSGEIALSYENGRKIILHTNQTSYLTKYLYYNGYQNFEYTEIFLELVKKLDLFLDIGANIGYYSLLAEMANKDMQIIGFEPAAGPLHFFQTNVKSNNFKNIKIESIALSHFEGSIDFYEIRNSKYTYLEHNLAGVGNTANSHQAKDFQIRKVPTTTLDKYVEANNLKSIDLIKMDTEGTEHLILEKSDMVLSKIRPIIICETLFDTIEDKLEAILLQHGYDFYNHTERGLEKVKSIQRESDNGVQNCFFVHPSKYHLIKDFVVS